MGSKSFVKRESSIELLKIFSMFLIVIGHVAQTVVYLKLEDFPVNSATTDIKSFIMAFLIHLGGLGNCIFIICSAWFLVDKNKIYTKKCLQIILDVFVISISILFCSLISGVQISTLELVKSLLPTTFANNWFATCYILFLLAVPYLNKILHSISKKELLRINIVLITLYWIINFIVDSLFYTHIILFISLFFITAYVKKYMPDFQQNVKMNLICLFVGLIGFIILMCITNYIGLKIEYMNKQLLFWQGKANPFFLLIAIALFNLFKRIDFSNNAVNLMSSVTLFVYLIHENLIVRRHFRRYIWIRIIDSYSLDLILIEELIYAIVLFVVSMLISLLYKFTIGRITTMLTDKIYNCQKLGNFITHLFNKIAALK